jgi:hypothetical protein
MHRAHTADTRPATIFINNGAPQALVGSQGRGEAPAEAFRPPSDAWRARADVPQL